MTQDELATILGADLRTVKGWEHGERNGLPAPIPQPVAILMTIAVRYPAVWRTIKKMAPKGH